MLKYKEMGFILDHFPIHDFKEREEIEKHLRHYLFANLIDPLVPGHKPELMIPNIELGLYHGL